MRTQKRKKRANTSRKAWTTLSSFFSSPFFYCCCCCGQFPLSPGSFAKSCWVNRRGNQKGHQLVIDSNGNAADAMWCVCWRLKGCCETLKSACYYSPLLFPEQWKGKNKSIHRREIPCLLIIMKYMGPRVCYLAGCSARLDACVHWAFLYLLANRTRLPGGLVQVNWHWNVYVFIYNRERRRDRGSGETYLR